MDDDTAALIRRLDAQYRADPFPGVEDWAGLDSSPRLAELLPDLRAAMQGADSRAMSAAIRERTRAAAWETGALEGLYSTDAGTTLTIAQQQAHWETVARNAGADARALFEAQLAGFDLVLDVATGAEPITERAIRGLHATICAPQDTYEVVTDVGVQERPLLKGTYKTDPNHVLSREGTPFAYAPVADVTHEMQRFVADVTSDAFASMSVDLKASWIHYAFVRIHPFADGNGRVVRALASVPSWRAASFPLVIDLEDRSPYLRSLAAADAGDHQAFASFVARRLVVTAETLGLAADVARLERDRHGREHRPGLSVPDLRAAVSELAREVRQAGVELGAEPLADGRVPQLVSHSGARPPTGHLEPTWTWSVAVQGGPTGGPRFHLGAPEPPNAEYDITIVRDDGEILLTFSVDQVASSGHRLRLLLRRELASLLDAADSRLPGRGDE